MRFRVLFAVAAVAFVLAPAARAATLPDLPGMGPAQKAVGGKSAATSVSTPNRRPPGQASVARTANHARPSVHVRTTTVGPPVVVSVPPRDGCMPRGSHDGWSPRPSLGARR